MNKKTLISIMSLIILLWLGMQFYVQPGQEVSSIVRITQLLYIPTIILPEFPGFINDSMADGLWMMALCILIITIWEFKVSLISISWYVLAVICGFIYEFLQINHIIPGVFDLNDIIAIAIGSAIPLIFLIKQGRNAQPN